MRLLSATFILMAILFGSAPGGTAVAAEEPVWTKGEVTKVKPDTGKVTIRHEEIANLDMPAMKMIFTAEDPALLEGLKPGDKREFYFVKENGRFMIKQIRE